MITAVKVIGPPGKIMLLKTKKEIVRRFPLIYSLLVFVHIKSKALLNTNQGPHGLTNGPYSIFKSIALIATIIVLSDISIAPTAGLKMIPSGARTPAANGIATML